MKHPQTTRMYGWRCSRLSEDRPFAPYAPGHIELPRDGVLQDAYFFIERDRVWSMTQHQRALLSNLPAL